MDKNLRKSILVVCAILITTSAVVISAFRQTPQPQQSIPISDTETSDAYQKAVDALQQKSNLSMTVLLTKTTTVAGDTFSEESTQEISYTGLGTKDMRGRVEQTLTIGTHTVSAVETYANSTGYFTIQDVSFRGGISGDAYLARYVPCVPITFSLYEAVSVAERDDATVITFADATAPEPWLSLQVDELCAASGTVYLDQEGNLFRSDFNVNYIKNGVQFHIHAVVNINDTADIKIDTPANADKYTKIQYLDAPRQLEIACGYLMIADTVSASYTNKTKHQAYGDTRTEKIAVNIHNGNSWSARIDTNIVLTNPSLGDTISKVSQTETFIDDQYVVTLDDTTEELSLGEETMRTLCRDQLIGTILLPQYIKDAKITETKDHYRIAFIPTDAFVKIIQTDIIQKLYQDSDDISHKYKTSTLSCYLDLDLKTRMPIASGISYVGTYKKDGITYTMSSDTMQTYDIVSTTAYEAIHKD